LSTATIRAVAQGVIGVAFIQAIVVGLCLLVAGVPWAGALSAERIVLYVFFVCTALNRPTTEIVSTAEPARKALGGPTRQTSDKMESMSEYSMTGFGHAIAGHLCTLCLRMEFGCLYFTHFWGAERITC
jgi:hypothetical protein